MTDEKIKRINILSKKAKEGSLTAEEEAERIQLRKEYIEAYKKDLRAQLENTYVIGADGVKRKLKKKK